MRLLPFSLCLALACDGPSDPREAEIIGVMAAADESFVRARPALSAGKYVRMAESRFAFYRGTIPLFRSDMRSGALSLAVSSFALDVPLVPSLGDPHPENFGVLRAPDGSLGLEPNDFDAADRAPYLWDVRRLATGMALAVMESNSDDADARATALEGRRVIVHAAIASYRDAIEEAARGTTLARITAANAGGPIVEDAFRRSIRDVGTEMAIVDGDRIRRGHVDPEDGQRLHGELPPAALGALPGALDRWRSTLVVATPPVVVLDAVRVFGGGVASWPRVRVLVLTEGLPAGRSLLELKELADSASSGLYGATVYHDGVGDRVVGSARAAWSRPDAEPLWGKTDWVGLACQVRRESEGQKGLRVARMVGDRGTVEALSALGGLLGAVVARMHASSDVAHPRAIAKRIAQDRERFVDEQTDVGIAYAELVRLDHERFKRALRRPDGLRLWIPLDPTDRPSADAAALFGSPPPPPPIPG